MLVGRNTKNYSYQSQTYTYYDISLATALGSDARILHSRSTAIGARSITQREDQIILGGSAKGLENDHGMPDDNNFTKYPDITIPGLLDVSAGACIGGDIVNDKPSDGSLYVKGKVGIGNKKNIPLVALDISYTDAIRLPVGTTSQRPIIPTTDTGSYPDGFKDEENQNISAADKNRYVGSIRYNSSNSQFEGFGPGDAWGSLGGVINVAQNTKIIASSPNADSTNNELIFYTAPTGSTTKDDDEERMRIMANGNVGIGTSQATSKLHVKGNAQMLTLHGSDHSYLALAVGDNGDGTPIRKAWMGFSSAGNQKLCFTNEFGSGSICINNDTKVGINNNTPTCALHVNGTDAIRIPAGYENQRPTTVSQGQLRYNLTSNGFEGHNGTNWTGLGGVDGVTSIMVSSARRVGINQTNPGYTLDVNGETSSTTFNATSDIRHKENVCDLENSLEKINAIRGVNFNFINDERKKIHSGIIAQEVNKVIPEIINNDNNDKLTANYDGLIPYLIESVKTLSNKNETIKQENEELKEKVNTLESKLEMIMKHLNL